MSNFKKYKTETWNIPFEIICHKLTDETTIWDQCVFVLIYFGINCFFVKIVPYFQPKGCGADVNKINNEKKSNNILLEIL